MTSRYPLTACMVRMTISAHPRLVEMLAYKYFDVIELLTRPGSEADKAFGKTDLIWNHEGVLQGLALQYGVLVRTFGEGTVLHNLRKIFGLKDLEKILKFAHPSGLPLRMRVTLLTARWYKW